MKTLLLLLALTSTQLINAKCVPPAQFGSIQVTVNGTFLDVDWSTNSELNNDYFVIERSTDSLIFNQIGTKEGTGNSSSTMNFSFTDSLASISGHFYYRVRQVDFNGDYSFSMVVEYSAVVDVLEFSNSAFSSYPNPTVDVLTIILDKKYSNVLVEMFDLEGNSVLCKSVSFSDKLTLDLSSFPAAVYVYKVVNEGKLLFEERVIKH